MFGVHTPRNLIKRSSSSSATLSIDSEDTFSEISSWGFGHTDDIDSDSRVPSAERILRYKKPDDDLFKSRPKNDEDDNVSVIESPFSDDEESGTELATSMPTSATELKAMLDDENNQFSKECLETLREMEDYKYSGISPPCSTCSLCSTCTEDTWDVLGIDESDLSVKPQPLDQKKADEIQKLHDEHSDLLNTLLSMSVNESEDDFKTDEEERAEIENELSLNSQINLEEFHGQSSKKHKNEKRSVRPSRRKVSGISKMLSTYDEDFFVAPPDYDYFRDEKLPYVPNLDDDVPWNIRERSRKKCSAWLNRCIPNDKI